MPHGKQDSANAHLPELPECHLFQGASSVSRRTLEGYNDSKVVKFSMRKSVVTRSEVGKVTCS
jgi:hypothetical protein